MHPTDLVAELGDRLNLTGLTLNGGVCRLVFDHSLPIDIEDDGAGNLCFHTVLAPLPHDGRESLLLTLMSSHLFGVHTDAATFGLHPKTQELYLFRLLPAEALDADTALTALERFTQQAETWRNRLESMTAEANASAPAETDPLTADALRA